MEGPLQKYLSMDRKALMKELEEADRAMENADTNLEELSKKGGVFSSDRALEMWEEQVEWYEAKRQDARDRYLLIKRAIDQLDR